MHPPPIVMPEPRGGQTKTKIFHQNDSPLVPAYFYGLRPNSHESGYFEFPNGNVPVGANSHALYDV